ncbi:hypothetical protein PGT21_020811 [Puccinia graminis f. sp. tritici]|uniref:Uncharacterized protein n=1 Tax=Puccinia graminis f. sp. tritici TaxID=56615 RepID=A0A5B0LW08_PUCGR|nr:hypothetical protein PGT21_020811 [Puccinia graminis f. sp. tritici]
MTNGCLLDSGASAHNIKQALAVPDAALWRAAAEYEMLKFGQLEVWVPVVALEMVAGYPLRIPAIRWPGALSKYSDDYKSEDHLQELGARI